MRAALVVALLVPLASGCILGEPEPHHVLFLNALDGPVDADVAVEKDGRTLFSRRFSLASQESTERLAFEGAGPGEYTLRVRTLDASGDERMHEASATMGRGGWGLYGTLKPEGLRVSTLHGD